MTDHSTTTHLPLDHESILKALLEAIDAASETDKELQGSTKLSKQLQHIKLLADQYREVAY